MERHMPLVAGLKESILTTPGDTEPALRRALEARSAELGGRPGPAVGEKEIPEELRGFADKVARHAYKVTERDIEELKRAGYSEDAIFEITLSLALGAGLSRLERALAALRGDESCG